MYRPASSQSTLKQRALALHYPLYLSLLTSIGVIFSIRLFMDYNWRDSALYGVTLVLSFWLGQALVALLSRVQTRSVK